MKRIRIVTCTNRWKWKNKIRMRNENEMKHVFYTSTEFFRCAPHWREKKPEKQKKIAESICITTGTGTVNTFCVFLFFFLCHFSVVFFCTPKSKLPYSKTKMSTMNMDLIFYGLLITLCKVKKATQIGSQWNFFVFLLNFCRKDGKQSQRFRVSVYVTKIDGRERIMRQYKKMCTCGYYWNVLASNENENDQWHHHFKIPFALPLLTFIVTQNF